MSDQSKNSGPIRVDQQRRDLVRITAAVLGVPGLVAATPALAASDPRPEFAARDIEQVLDFFFGTRFAADDASIQIVAPLVTEQRSLVPFEVRAPGADRIAVMFDGNDEPLIIALDQAGGGSGLITARARLERSGLLHCYAMRGDQLGRATRQINVAGHWLSGLKE